MGPRGAIGRRAIHRLERLGHPRAMAPGATKPLAKTHAVSRRRSRMDRLRGSSTGSESHPGDLWAARNRRIESRVLTGKVISSSLSLRATRDRSMKRALDVYTRI